MENLFKEVAGGIALTLEAMAVLLVVAGAIGGVYGVLRALTLRPGQIAGKKQAWLGFGTWLLLGLEFELGADIIRTAIAPTWQELGQLAVIAVIRTFLNYFLERDLEKYARRETPAPADTTNQLSTEHWQQQTQRELCETSKTKSQSAGSARR